MRYICNKEKVKIPKNCIPLLGMGPRDPGVWALEGREGPSKGPRDPEGTLDSVIQLGKSYTYLTT